MPVTGGFGFGAVPDELRHAAGAIDDAIGGVVHLLWQGPAGHYGHAGVQRGWAAFVEDAQREVRALYTKAAEHGESLRAAVSEYLENEAETGAVLRSLGALVDGGGLDPSVVPGGGITGGMADEVRNAANSGRVGLNPNVVPGGGATGGIADVLDGSNDTVSGVMNPDLAREMAESQGMNAGTGAAESRTELG